MSEYANIDRVYRIVKNFFNKEQHGNLKVGEFNAFADYVQKKLFRETLEQYRKALRLRFSKSQHMGGMFSSYEDVLQDIRTLHVAYEPLTSLTSNNIFEYPSDYQYYTQISVGNTPCEIVTADDEEYSYIMTSNLAKPTTSFPVAVFKRGKIEVLPTTVTAASLSYFKTPQGVDANNAVSTQPPTWAYTTVSGNELYNAANSINFELPINMENKIAIGILECFGINMREEQIAQYSMLKDQQQKQSE